MYIHIYIQRGREKKERERERDRERKRERETDKQKERERDKQREKDREVGKDLKEQVSAAKGNAGRYNNGPHNDKKTGGLPLTCNGKRTCLPLWHQGRGRGETTGPCLSGSR